MLLGGTAAVEGPVAPSLSCPQLAFVWRQSSTRQAGSSGGCWGSTSQPWKGARGMRSHRHPAGARQPQPLTGNKLSLPPTHLPTDLSRGQAQG